MLSMEGDADEEMVEYEQLEKKRVLLNEKVTSCWYKQSKKAIQKKYLNKRLAEADLGAPVARKARIFIDWEEKQWVKATDFEKAAHSLKTIYTGFSR